MAILAIVIIIVFFLMWARKSTAQERAIQAAQKTAHIRSEVGTKLTLVKDESVKSLVAGKTVIRTWRDEYKRIRNEQQQTG